MVTIGELTIYNTTPHAIIILDASGRKILEIPAADTPLRLEEETEPYISIETQEGSIPVVKKTLKLSGLELIPPRKNTYYVVPLAVAQKIAEHEKREDLLVPDGLVRGPSGAVAGATRFAIFVTELTKGR